MDRRTVIKDLCFITAGTILLPSCLHQDEKVVLQLKNFSLNDKQEKTVNSVIDTLIPKTDTPGALDLKVDAFALKMVDECQSKKDQQSFVTGIDDLNDLSKKNYGSLFTECSLQQRKTLLSSIDSRKDFPVTLIAFYKIIKERTIQGYTTSHYFLTNQSVYELVPGRYNGYFPLRSKVPLSKKNV